MKTLKEKMLELEKGGRSDKLLLNILYYLVTNYLACKSCRAVAVDDLELLYDNLYFNNEIITDYNMDDYDLNKLGLTAKTVAAIAAGEKVLLLNYYKLTSNYTELVNCKILLNNIDDKLVY
jgi:hypothetical protein